MHKLSITVQQRHGDGSIVLVKAEGKVVEQKGTDEQLYEALLEAEMHGNAGKARVHIFVH